MIASRGMVRLLAASFSIFSFAALETDMALPTFKYHPDPVATGHVVESDTECACCGKSRGFIYTGPVFAVEEYNEQICPWCIADGSAHGKLDASVTDEVGIGGGDMWDEVPEAVIEEVAYRTPGFCGWQQEQCWTHCGDAAEFFGRAGRKELKMLGPQAIAAIQDFAGLADGPGRVELPHALARKYPNANQEWCCQFVFPQERRWRNPTDWGAGASSRSRVARPEGDPQRSERLD